MQRAACGDHVECLSRSRVPQVVFKAAPPHVLVDALEGFTEAEQGDLDGTVEDTPAELPGQEDLVRPGESEGYYVCEPAFSLPDSSAL